MALSFGSNHTGCPTAITNALTAIHSSENILNRLIYILFQ